MSVLTIDQLRQLAETANAGEGDWYPDGKRDRLAAAIAQRGVR